MNNKLSSSWHKFFRFLLACSVLALAVPTPSQAAQRNSSVSFGVMSDMHCTPEEEFHFKGILKAVNHFNELSLDFVIELGDSIGGINSLTNVQAEFSTMERAYSRSTIPRYYVLGNHEWVNGFSADQNAALWRDTLGLNSTYYSFDKMGFHFVVLDSVSVSTSELDWLKADLAATSLKTVIFSHYPIVDYDSEGIGWAPGNSVIQKILEESGHVIAAFNGHLHKNVSKTENGIHYYTINDFPLDAYAVATVFVDGSIEIRGYGTNHPGGQDSYYETSKSLFDNNWANKKEITLNASLLNGMGSNVPVKLHLRSGSSSIFDNSQPNGEDIRFVDNSGKVLSYKIDFWDKKTQDAVVWVKIPQISMVPSVTNTVTMYYGNPAARDAQDVANVWDTRTVINRFSSLNNVFGTSVLVSAKYPDVESPFSLGDNIVTPIIGVSYNTTYNPTGTWDWSSPGLMLSSWIGSNLSSSNFSSARLYAVDTAGDYLFWDLSFPENEWKSIRVPITSGQPSSHLPDLTHIDKIVFEFVPSSDTPFYKKLGWTETITEYDKSVTSLITTLTDPLPLNNFQLAPIGTAEKAKHTPVIVEGQNKNIPFLSPTDNKAVKSPSPLIPRKHAWNRIIDGITSFRDRVLNYIKLLIKPPMRAA